MRDKVRECIKYIRKITDFVPDIAMILGSGLGGYTRQMDEVICSIPYSRIPGFPVSTVSGHAGKYVMGYIKGVPVICMEGRVHYYEGYDITDVVLPVRLMKLMGAKALFLTNAAGGANFDFQPGDLMLITDHIAQFVPSPLMGPNLSELGPRFADMSHVYNPEFQVLIKEAAKTLDIKLQQGVYLQFTGPAYETPSEVKMARILGADAVGMSTACEAVAANHMGMKICGVSCVCNLAAGISPTPLTHDEVQQAANEAAPKFKKLLTEAVKKF
jgi:purine-nucleoside phosphorylase